MMPWADFGFDLYSMSIMASEKTMKEKPKQLKAFLEASYMGWRDVMADPKAAMVIFKKRVPEIDVEAMTAEHDDGPRADEDRAYAKNGIGSIDDKRMCASVDLVNTYMGLPKKVDCKDVYTKDFYTKVDDAEVTTRGGRPLIDLSGVGMTYRGGERPGRGARRHLAHRRRRRVRVAGRPERLRQVDLAAHRGGPAAGDRRHRRASPAARSTSRSPTSAWSSRRRSC